MRSVWSSFLRLLPLAGLILSSAVYVSCDATARIFLRLVQFSEIEMLSATPVKQVTNAEGNIVWVPACGEPAEAVKISFNLKSGDRKGDNDLDRQIRPNEDAVNKKQVIIGDSISENNFSIKLNCLQAHDGTTTANASCNTGQKEPNHSQVSESALFFQDNLLGHGRGTPVGVAFLIDQTGSTSGTVDTSPILGFPSCLEAADGTYEAGDPDQCRSDHANHRVEKVKSMISMLNDRDPVIVFAQNEEKWEVLCHIPGKDNPTHADKLANCYHHNRVLSLGNDIIPAAMDALDGQGKGRSNLWSALNKTWKFMSDKKEVVRHIIVMADGPDNCHAASDDFQHCFSEVVDPAFPPEFSEQKSCGESLQFKTIRNTIKEYVDQGKDDMHVSFVHFQAKGAPQMDPQMQEIACLTGGHYIFLNFNTLSESFAQSRNDAITRATSAIRYSLGGYWNYVIDIPTYRESQAENPSNAKSGQVYSVSGILTMDLPSFKNTVELYSFTVGGEAGGNVDNRMMLRKHCTDDLECGPAGAGECGMRCSKDTRTCMVRKVGSACSAEGIPGVCCQGSCQAGKTYCNDPGDLWSCP
jgi:hypothetical protein